MDAVEFVLAKKRLCEGRFCSECTLHNLCGNEDSNRAIAEQIVTKVEQWAKDHPVKTRQSEFLKMFPNAKINEGNGIISISPCALDSKFPYGDGCIGRSCNGCRRDYWLQELG